MKIDTILFDFDGTLADMNEIMFRILNQLARENNRPELTEETARRFQNMHPKDVLKEYGVPIWRIPFLLVRGRQLLKERVESVQLVPGILDVVGHLKLKGKRLGIVTSNSKENVLSVLRRYHAESLFDFIYSENTIFGKEKALKKVMNREKIKPGMAVYVGDEVRDVEGSKKCGLPVVSVTWGLNGKQILEKSSPTWIISKPHELEKLFS
jgi:phosphoglycolate phosphatase